MGRTSDARERLVGAATELLQERSYHAVGVSDICAAADVRKGSFYYFFDSKQALTLAAVDAHWAAQAADWRTALSGRGKPMNRLHRLLDETADLQRGFKDAAGVVHGCALANLALEIGNAEQPIRARLEEIFDEQAAMIAAVVAEAIAAGDLAPDLDPGWAGRAVVAQIEGVVLLAKLRNDPTVMDELWPAVIRLLGRAGDGR